MLTARVDGYDVFAVYNVTKAARDICITSRATVLYEHYSIYAAIIVYGRFV